MTCSPAMQDTNSKKIKIQSYRAEFASSIFGFAFSSIYYISAHTCIYVGNEKCLLFRNLKLLTNNYARATYGAWNATFQWVNNNKKKKNFEFGINTFIQYNRLFTSTFWCGRLLNVKSSTLQLGVELSTVEEHFSTVLWGCALESTLGQIELPSAAVWFLQCTVDIFSASANLGDDSTRKCCLH